MNRILILVIALALGACASPYVQEQGADDGPARFEDETFVTRDGLRLTTQIWRAETPNAVVIGLHGMNEYANAFAMPGTWLAERGMTLYAYDQRGFGRSPGRGLWPGAKAMAQDVEDMVALVHSRHSDLPIYLMGVSMGGAVALATLARSDDLDVNGLILVAPAVWGWSVLNPLYKLSLWIGAHTFPSKALTGSGLKIMPSDNIEMLRANYYDDLVIKATRTDAIYGLVDLMDEGYLSADDVTVPTLLLYGVKDEIIPRKPVENAAARIGGPKRIVVYQNGYHMLLRDLQAETVWRDISAWVADPKGPLPSGEEQKRVSVN